MPNESSMTPMMKQYFQMKSLHPEALLLFRCGDFYETYGDDAQTASRVLGIALTKRSSVMKEQIPMAGFPYHAIESFLAKLIRAGFKVAICDQLEDPKLTKNIVKRGITELITPGIVLSETVLSQKDNIFLAGIAFGDKEIVGASFLDVSTGEFKLTEGSAEYVHTLIASMNVKEVVVEKCYEKQARQMLGELADVDFKELFECVLALVGQFVSLVLHLANELRVSRRLRFPYEAQQGGLICRCVEEDTCLCRRHPLAIGEGFEHPD